MTSFSFFCVCVHMSDFSSLPNKEFSHSSPLVVIHKALFPPLSWNNRMTAIISAINDKCRTRKLGGEKGPCGTNTHVAQKPRERSCFTPTPPTEAATATAPSHCGTVIKPSRPSSRTALVGKLTSSAAFRSSITFHPQYRVVKDI